ncbi:hypothetical protein HMPREF9446_01134 [Bacteroides fluxus YIT 12057]|uniref:Uncharacterized protein n=1 Tax=Bacteroides fluxus YIT 12057 TaxID=763034 RepID=F3PQY6_9BACE|nr:hypothetical protein HMPREF9446_01134 [Bacteroides fluxus YIT 12057]
MIESAACLCLLRKAQSRSACCADNTEEAVLVFYFEVTASSAL